MPFLLTRPSRGATCGTSEKLRGKTISTHTPLAGRDLIPFFNYFVVVNFYSHAPRGARPHGVPVLVHSHNFYSHAPRGARQVLIKL